MWLPTHTHMMTILFIWRKFGSGTRTEGEKLCLKRCIFKACPNSIVFVGHWRTLYGSSFQVEGPTCENLSPNAFEPERGFLSMRIKLSPDERSSLEGVRRWSCLSTAGWLAECGAGISPVVFLRPISPVVFLRPTERLTCVCSLSKMRACRRYQHHQCPRPPPPWSPSSSSPSLCTVCGCTG